MKGQFSDIHEALIGLYERYMSVRDRLCEKTGERRGPNRVLDDKYRALCNAAPPRVSH